MPTEPYAPNTVIVLWGDRYDEMAATVFTSALRQRGLRVYLVGVDGPTSVGATGVMINVDRSFGQVARLIGQAICIVLPCDATALLRAENDPRFGPWLREIVQRNCRIVVQDAAVVHATAMRLLPITAGQVLVYGHQSDLPHFADELATLLLAEAEKGTVA